MASSQFSLLFYSLSLLLLHQPLSSTAHLHSLRPQDFFFPEQRHSTSLNETPPTRYFEVTKPIKLPKTTPPCSHLVLSHDFAFTYGKPPVLSPYNPPLHCPSRNFSKIVLEWRATCRGRQFDRIFGLWLGGVELLRSCTAEPRATGIIWTVEKDITRYSSLLLKKNQTLAVYLGNLIDSTYTGVYHVNVTFHFYPFEESFKGIGSDDGGVKWADLILPISRNLPLNDGLWFEIENSTDFVFKEVRIPRNAYRAVLEVYVSFHENDEFWYSNVPNEYIDANNLTSTPGNGPFREVVVSLDGELVGAVWPFTVVYTGGVNPLLWRPISGIGSFNLPSYDIEITPFLGRVLDGKSHRIGFNVTNALNVWYVDANLHLWLDENSARTEGEVVEHVGLPIVVSLVANFTGLNGTFLTGVSRSVKSTGWVKSSYGNVTTGFTQDFFYNNSMVMGNNGNLQIVDQTIYFNYSVDTNLPTSSQFHSLRSNKKFSINMYTNFFDQENKTSLFITNVTLGFNKKKSEGSSRVGFSTSTLENLQSGQGYMVVKDKLVVRGLGSTQQVYKYSGPDLCYFRNLSSSNYTILYDHVRSQCSKRAESYRGFQFHRLWPFHARRISLADLLENPKGD